MGEWEMSIIKQELYFEAYVGDEYLVELKTEITYEAVPDTEAIQKNLPIAVYVFRKEVFVGTKRWCVYGFTGIRV